MFTEAVQMVGVGEIEARCELSRGAAIGAGAQRFRWWALGLGAKTVVEEAATGRLVTGKSTRNHYPNQWSHAAGGVGNYLCLITLENVSAAPPQPTG